ncbi:ribosomal 40S subunit protein S13 [Coelomomyces lativittatus]|nr:ribosomal 40S subunit protein S13 [Coelomomyces lativittatus]
MGRMHTPGKGISSSALPYRRTPPVWCKTAPTTVVDHICKYARKGMTPSQIGVLLRDSHAIPLVKNVTGTKILRILKSNGIYFFNAYPVFIFFFRNFEFQNFNCYFSMPCFFFFFFFFK